MQDIKITNHGVITYTTMKDVQLLDRTARIQDRREVEDISGMLLIENLILAHVHAIPCLTARTHSGVLLGICGVMPNLGGRGTIAFIGTQAIEQHPKAFLRGAKDIVAYFQKRHRFRDLHNVVDARNHTHIRFLKWLGFTFLERVEKFGAAQIPVYPFTLKPPS